MSRIGKDHRAQLLLLHRTPQESHRVPESIVQISLSSIPSFPDTQPKLPQLQAIPSGPVTGHQIEISVWSISQVKKL